MTSRSDFETIPGVSESLPDSALVHRALRSRRWVDEDTGELQAVAFFLREHEDAVDGGISVSESAEAAISVLSKCFRICDASSITGAQRALSERRFAGGERRKGSDADR
jgi:hypothetical protein